MHLRAVAVGAWCSAAGSEKERDKDAAVEGERKKRGGTVGGLRVEGRRRRGEESRAAEGTWVPVGEGRGRGGTSYVFRVARTHSCVGGHTCGGERDTGEKRGREKRRRRER